MPILACWCRESLAASAQLSRRAGVLAQLPDAKNSERILVRQVGESIPGSIDQIDFFETIFIIPPCRIEREGSAVNPANKLPHPSFLERSVSGDRSNQRLNIVTMFLHLFGHLLFLRRHLRLLFGVSIGVM